MMQEIDKIVYKKPASAATAAAPAQQPAQK
jgi:hypothetical protein